MLLYLVVAKLAFMLNRGLKSDPTTEKLDESAKSVDEKLESIAYFLESQDIEINRKHTFETEESKYAIYLRDCSFFWDVAETMDGV